MQPKVILVLGAGATVGGGFKIQHNGKPWTPPMDFNFFETPVVERILTGTRNYPTLSYYRQGNSLEYNWAKIDLYYKLCHRGLISEKRALAQLKNKMKRSRIPGYLKKMTEETQNPHLCVPSMALWELRYLASRVFAKLTHQQKSRSPLFRLVRELRDKKLLTAVVTFNYDTSVEYLFGRSFHYPYLPHQDSTIPPLMKLHGSLNWQADSGSCPHIWATRPITQVAETDHDGQNWKQPEVIGPTFFKQEITFDIEVKCDFRAQFYKKLWHFAWEELKTATHLLFVGFSFPQTDFHAAALFRTAHLSSKGFRHIILCHYHDPNVRRTAEHVFGGKRTELTEFSDGLERMVNCLDELVSLLKK